MSEKTHTKSGNSKKVLLTAAIVLDAVITIALLVISIVMLAETIGKSAAEIQNGTGFINYLQKHTTFYFCLFVLPLFILLALNIVGLVFYVRKTSRSEPVKVTDLSDAQKEELKKQILADLQKQASSPKDEEKKNDTDTSKKE